MIKNSLLSGIRQIINPLGYDLVKFKENNPAQIIYSHLKLNDIDTVIDVGANTGQYGFELRKAGFKKK